MAFYKLIGIIATISLLLPVIVILIHRLTAYRSFPALLAYYIILLGYNILKTGYVVLTPPLGEYYITTTNLLNAPLILLFLSHFSNSVAQTKRLHLLAIVYTIYELITVASFGYNLDASVIAMAPGLLILACFSLVLFVRYVKMSILHQQKGIGKALVSTALVFANLGYCFIFVFLYIVHTQFKSDAYIVYFLINTISSLIMAVGIHHEGKRVRQLEELLTTREELKKLYGEEEGHSSSPSAGAVFKFDNDQWN